MSLHKTSLLLFFVLIFLGLESRLVAEGRLTRSSKDIAREITADHKVTVGSYCDFLNVAAASDPQGFYDETIRGIVRMGEPGSYRYVVVSGATEEAVIYVDQISAISYLNSLDHTVVDLTYDEQLHSNLIFFEEVMEEIGIMRKTMEGGKNTSSKEELLLAAALLGSFANNESEGGSRSPLDPENERGQVTDYDLGNSSGGSRRRVMNRMPSSPSFANATVGDALTAIVPPGASEQRRDVLGSHMKEHSGSSVPRSAQPAAVQEIPLDSSRFLSSTQRTVTQVPNPQERVTETLEALQQETQVVHQITDLLHEFIKANQASKTMSCLRALDFTSMSPEMGALWGSNQGEGSGELLLILNKSNVPLCIPASDADNTASATSIIPTIIPVGIKTTINGNGYQSPDRIPATVENKAVRKFIKEAFEIYCGKAKSQELLPAFYITKNEGEPVKIKDLQEAFGGAEGLMEEGNNQVVRTFSEKYKVSLAGAEALRKNLALGPRDETEQEQSRELFQKASEALTAPEKALLEALWYSGEVVARNGAAIGGHLLTGIVGGVTGLVIGSAVGGVVGSIAAGGLVATFGSSFATFSLTGAALGISTGLVESPYGFKYFAPDVAAQKAVEALGAFRGEGADKAVTLMQEAQDADRGALIALEALLENLPDFNLEEISSSSQSNGDGNNSASSGEAAAENGIARKANSHQVMNLTQVREVFVSPITGRIAYRQGLITKLEAIIDSKKEKQQKADAMTRTAEFRARYPRGM